MSNGDRDLDPSPWDPRDDCIGAALARVEGRAVLPAVLRRFPDIALLDAQPSWRPTFVTRHLAKLPVATGR